MSNPDPMMLAKKGNSMNPSQHEQQIDPALIQALARVIAERGMRQPGYSPGFQEGLNQGAAEDAYAQDAAQSRAQFGMMQDGSPNALQGGRTSGFADAVAEGDPNSELYRMFVGAPQPTSDPHWERAFSNPGPELDAALDAFGKGFRETASPSSEPNALTGGLTNPRQDWSGGFLSDAATAGAGALGYPQDDVARATDPRVVEYEQGAKPKKKKGEYSDFFKLLKAAKSGDKTTKKSITDLAKQLEASGGEVPVT